MKDSNLAAQKTEVSYLFLNKIALKLPVPQQSQADHLNLKRPPLPALESILFSSATPALLYCRNCSDENRAESSQKLNCMTHCIRWTGSVCRLVETDLQTTQNWQQPTRSVLSVSINKKKGAFSAPAWSPCVTPTAWTGQMTQEFHSAAAAVWKPSLPGWPSCSCWIPSPSSEASKSQDLGSLLKLVFP